MSMQEMVRLLHSVHLHTAGHESSVSDAAALAHWLRSVNSAHVITCIAGWMDGLQLKILAKFVSAVLQLVPKNIYNNK